MTTRVLVVCLGNICRSPTAEAAVREAAAEDGLELAGQARQVTVDDFREFDLVVAMDGSNHADLLRLAPDDDARARVRLFREYAGEAGEGVPDPYYGGPDGFREVVAIVRRAARGLVDAVARGEA